YFVTNYESEYNYVAMFDLEKQAFSPVVTIDQESVAQLKWDQTNRKLYLLTHSGVRDRLYSYDVDSGDLKQRPLPIDVVSQLSIAKSGHLYMLGTSSTTPPNIYQSIDGKSWQPLTDNR